MRLDKRAVTVAVAGVAAGVLLGYWAGAVAGVLAALAGLVPAAALQAAGSWQSRADARRRRLAADAGFAARVIEVPAAGPDGGGVARLLRPEAEVVGFWPRKELADLARWVASEQRASVRLVAGPGGSGKTRLARQLGEEVEPLGWRAWWVPAGQEASAAEVAAAGGVPVLLVVDYAETRPGLAGLLATVGRGREGPAVRVLLLARSAGEWWQRLCDGSPDEVSDLLAGAGPVVLGPVSGGAGEEAVFGEAVKAFAAVRGVACPEVVLGEGARGGVVLVVHAAALLAVLDAETGTSSGDGGAGGDVLGGLLGHERRYWQQSLEARLPGGLDPDVIDRAVTAGSLAGASSQEEAMRLLEVIPDLGDGRLRGTVARWLADLYPVPAGGEGTEWIGALQPDPLAERLAVSVLSRHPGLAGRLLAGLGEARAERALTVLARAALTQPAALPLIGQALDADPAGLLVPAITVAAATNPAIAGVIAGVHAAAVLSLDTLIAMTRAIPFPTVGLAGLGAAVTGQILDALPPDTVPADRARWLGAHGVALAQAGRPAEALPVTQEAAAVYRELAAASPDRYRPALAGALTNLGNRYSQVGHPAKALPVTQEAVTVHRELAAASPDRYRPRLADALKNLGSRYSELGRPVEAAESRAEASPLSDTGS
ncbi:MAG TPA: tetratricopeptide repeat protein [Streptosporangiaceae bacterium]